MDAPSPAVAASPTESAARAVVRLALPAIATGLLSTLVFLADRVMLARHRQDELASMQLQGPLLWSVGSVFMAVCAGTVALVARSTGAGDLVRARAVARASLRLAAVLGLVVGGLGIALLEPLVLVFGPDDPALRGLSASYLRLTFASLPFEFVALSASMILAGSGDTRSPLFAGAIANLTNIAINALLIYGHDLPALGLHIPALGVRGAATGTAIAFVIEAVVLLRVLGRDQHPLGTRGWWRGGDPHGRPALRDLLQLGTPAVLERVLVHAGFLSYAKAVATLGAVAMAANQALITVESICFMCADGFGVAAATVMGQRLGRGDPSGAREGGGIALAMAVAAITSLGVTVWLTGGWTLPMFVPPGADGTALVALAAQALPLLALSQPGMTAGIVLSMGLRGVGDTRTPLLAATVGGLLIRVTLAWTFAIGLDMGLVGVWWASTIDWCVRATWLTIVFVRGRWTRIVI